MTAHGGPPAPQGPYGSYGPPRDPGRQAPSISRRGARPTKAERVIPRRTGPAGQAPRTLVTIVAGVAVFAVGLAIGVGLGSGSKTDPGVGVATVTVNAAAAPAPTAPAPAVPADDAISPAPAPAGPAGAASTMADGIFVVGEDVQPGTYKTSAVVDKDCGWVIYTSGSNGEDQQAYGFPNGGRPEVTLKAGTDFKSHGCGDWVKK